MSGCYKTGFSAPDAAWFKSQNHDLIADNLFDPQNGLYDIIDPKVSRALLDEHIGGQTNRRLLTVVIELQVYYAADASVNDVNKVILHWFLKRQIKLSRVR